MAKLAATLCICSMLLLSAVAVHWYVATSDTDLADRLRRWYFCRDPMNLKLYVLGLVDFVAPNVILGLIVGAFGRSWPKFGNFILVVLLALVVSGLFPLYAQMFAEYNVSFWPTDPVDRFTSIIRRWWLGTCLCGAFAYAARIATDYAWNRDSAARS